MQPLHDGKDKMKWAEVVRTKTYNYKHSQEGYVDEDKVSFRIHKKCVPEAIQCHYKIKEEKKWSLI
jgi:hypothetical protein